MSRFDLGRRAGLQAALPWQQRQPGYAVRWLDIAEARAGGAAISIDVRPLKGQILRLPRAALTSFRRPVSLDSRTSSSRSPHAAASDGCRATVGGPVGLAVAIEVTRGQGSCGIGAPSGGQV